MVQLCILNKKKIKDTSVFNTAEDIIVSIDSKKKVCQEVDFRDLTPIKFKNYKIKVK